MIDTDSRRNQEWLQAVSWIHMQQQQYTQAITLLEALLVIYPKHFSAQKMLALAYFHNGQFHESLRTIDSLLSEKTHIDHNGSDKNAPLWLIRTKALWALGRAEAAHNTLKTYQKHRQSETCINHPTGNPL